ncbi:hypothetical protein DFJ43DRAFT_88522 [Lentinula guzmanii]|uniref:Uncharacterized protein n=1 Tax=Lentinula guzmanii TaxID=2804957 RepID=A0AA38MVB1_9AGAR|nr:hypothetical protein DFJ43DRAFT_88522 [Lentinula guzmanii]
MKEKMLQLLDQHYLCARYNSLSTHIIFTLHRKNMNENYLYLTHENFLKLEEQGHDSFKIVDIEVEGESRHKITDIIGLQDGLGVESLKGSLPAKHLGLTMTFLL